MSELVVVYDGDCPFCRNYCDLVRIREAVGSITLVDAREPSPILQEITDLGLDIDQGMVVKFEDRIFYGGEAINILTKFSTRSGFFNRVNYLFFFSRRVSLILYPFLRNCRNLVLWMLCIPKIDNLNKEKNHG